MPVDKSIHLTYMQLKVTVNKQNEKDKRFHGNRAVLSIHRKQFILMRRLNARVWNVNMRTLIKKTVALIALKAILRALSLRQLIYKTV